jgi:hypothetical protein
MIKERIDDFILDLLTDFVATYIVDESLEEGLRALPRFIRSGRILFRHFLPSILKVYNKAARADDLQSLVSEA